MYDLIYAAAVGDTATVQRVLQRSEQTNQLDHDLTRVCGRGRTALHHGALSGALPIVQLLLDAGMTSLLPHDRPHAARRSCSHHQESAALSFGVLL